MEKKQRKNSDTVEMFYGFWKHLGVTACFLIGVVMSWWGFNIFMEEWFLFRHNAGFMSIFILFPMISGLALAWLSFVEFLRIIRKE